LQEVLGYDPDDPETKRKRRETANRIFNDLSALLTLAYRNQRVSSKAAWETVDKFDNVDVAKNEYLTLKEAIKFLKVCPIDFRDLVQGALITGCRYGELARLKSKRLRPPVARYFFGSGEDRQSKACFSD
jgi:integrase